MVTNVTPSAGSCTTPAGQVVCTIGALANGGAATVAITLTLDGTTDPATDTATIVGHQRRQQSERQLRFGLDRRQHRSRLRTPTRQRRPAGTATIAVLANDTDADGDTLTGDPLARLAPTKGSIVVNADNTITYTANAGAVGHRHLQLRRQRRPRRHGYRHGHDHDPRTSRR